MTITFTALKVVAIAFAALGAAIGDGLIVSNFLNSASRQPELWGRLMGVMIMGVSFVEATFFIALGMAFVIN